jgi:hypothetical protein
MQIETPPSDDPREKPSGACRGIVIVNTGKGKGKSTAAFGLALRAHGRGKAVKIYQLPQTHWARQCRFHGVCSADHRFTAAGLPGAALHERAPMVGAWR